MGRQFITAMSLAVAGVLCASCCGVRVEDGRVKVPYRRSEDAIRRELLQYTPIGTSKEEVVTFIQNSLRCKDIDPAIRFKSWTRDGAGALVEVPPMTYLRVTLAVYPGGGYGLPVRVWAEWGFDDVNRLEELEVRKEIDAP